MSYVVECVYVCEAWARLSWAGSQVERERLIRGGAVARISWAERLGLEDFHFLFWGRTGGRIFCVTFQSSPQLCDTSWKILINSSFSEILSTEEDDLEVLVVVVERKNEIERSAFFERGE